MTRRSNLAIDDSNYAFPVETQPVLTKEGTPIPGHLAVRRTDTGNVLSIVSNKYNLVRHQEVVDAAESFVTALGEPTRRYSVQRHGAVLVAQLDYAAHKAEVELGEFASLRVFMQSSYTGAQMNKIRVGGQVLSCKNGMTVPSKQFSHYFRHVGSAQMEFPHVDAVLEQFFLEAEVWKRYAEREAGDMYKQLAAMEIDKIMPLAGAVHVADHLHEIRTVWHFLQACTYYVTHINGSGPLGKMNMLDRISRWFHQRFKE